MSATEHELAEATMRIRELEHENEALQIENESLRTRGEWLSVNSKNYLAKLAREERDHYCLKLEFQKLKAESSLIRECVTEGYDARARDPRCPCPYKREDDRLKWYSWMVGGHEAWLEREVK